MTSKTKFTRLVSQHGSVVSPKTIYLYLITVILADGKNEMENWIF